MGVINKRSRLTSKCNPWYDTSIKKRTKRHLIIYKQPYATRK